MNPTRRIFEATKRALVDLLGSAALSARWSSPSVLNDMTVGALAGHVGRTSSWVIEEYLAEPPPAPGAVPVTAAEYYAALPIDVSSPVHRGVMERGAQIAMAGADSLRQRVVASLDRLALQLADLPPDHLVTVLGATPMFLDEYLKTRIVEAVLHGDDLALSIGVVPPAINEPTGELIAHLSVDVVRLRVGELAVVRAFYRRERQSSDTLRVF